MVNAHIIAVLALTLIVHATGMNAHITYRAFLMFSGIALISGLVCKAIIWEEKKTGK